MRLASLPLLLLGNETHGLVGSIAIGLGQSRAKRMGEEKMKIRNANHSP
jgi:hypothetical protein